MVTNDSTVSQNTSTLGAGDSSSSGGFFITAGLQSMSSSSSFGGGITKAHPSSSVNVPHLAPIQSAPQLHQGSHTGVKRPRVTFKSRFGSTMQEIQSRFDEIMEESDDIVERAEMVAAAKKAREQTKKNRLAKKGRRASVESTAAKQERLDKIEAKREAKRQQREKEKKNDKRKRAWSKAGASQKEVIDIISAFQQIDEDLTGEIDPKEFFALPQFSGFASAGTMDTLFRAIDRDGSGTVTVDELLIVMFPVATKSDVKEMIQMAHKVKYGSKKEKKKVATLSAEQRQDIETIFRMYDTDNSNTVSLVELLAALGEKLRNIMTSAEIAAIFETFDADKNSDLDLDEFIHLYEEYFLVPVEQASNGGPPSHQFGY